jgi:hypothetical protein
VGGWGGALSSFLSVGLTHFDSSGCSKHGAKLRSHSFKMTVQLLPLDMQTVAKFPSLWPRAGKSLIYAVLPCWCHLRTKHLLTPIRATCLVLRRFNNARLNLQGEECGGGGCSTCLAPTQQHIASKIFTRQVKELRWFYGTPKFTSIYEHKN